MPERAASPAEQIFADALARPEQERAAFLDGACGGDAALRERIMALLKAHAGPESLLAAASMPSGAVLIDLSAAGLAKAEEKPGAAIGHYKLLQKIGEGGCGVVWMAEQEEPVRRRVALKIIKLGMDTKAVVARFEAERQALAMMEHPNIAKVHDAGATETGRPYFVMELVRGIPITKYCDENHLTPTARLELFIKVCQAVQHAHQKGIIHRDIKPSNILVTVNDGAPTPKVIDFGIAKATQGRLTDATVFTAFEQFIGTPVYMSPEQAEMSSLDIDTRADIYSLGVLLYELLTGRPPFDPKKFAQAGVDQIRKQIREVEPPRPSARLSTLDADERTTIAHLRGTAAANLSIILRGDLDWIVMRCIEKDRTRRYDTANGLAMDIQRYLRNEPVVARPPSTAYLLQKLVRRHRLGFAAGVAITTSLVAGLGLAFTAYMRERIARNRTFAAEQREREGRHRAEAAEASARQAEKVTAAARTEAEGLLGFVFTELMEELHELGQLPLLQSVCERSVLYYTRLPEELRTADTRAGHALALTWLGSAHISRGQLELAAAKFEAATKIFEELERTDALAPAARVAYAAMLERRAYQRMLEGPLSDVASIAQRGMEVATAAMNSAEVGGWAERVMARLLTVSANALVHSGKPLEGRTLIERAMVHAENSDRRAPRPKRPGLLSAQTLGTYSNALSRSGQVAEARAANEAARVQFARYLELEPALVETRAHLAATARHRADHLTAEWRFPEAMAANLEAQRAFAQVLAVNPNRIELQNDLAFALNGRGDSEFGHHWRFRDFAAAEVAGQKAIDLLSVDWAVPFMLGNRYRALFNCARLYAATGRDAEANRCVIEAEKTLQRRLLNRDFPAVERARLRSDFDADCREVEFQRLNFRAVRENAQAALDRLGVEELEGHLTLHRGGAHRDLMRAAFELGDVAAAKRALNDWSPATSVQPGTAEIQHRFNRLGNLLTRIHVLARTGSRDAARSELARIWPEVDAVFAAGADYLFNQVQTARALSIRAEIDGSPDEKRVWLERAAGWLRPAAAAGKLTRYEREVLLAGIEKQLAAVASATSP